MTEFGYFLGGSLLGVTAVYIGQGWLSWYKMFKAEKALPDPGIEEQIAKLQPKPAKAKRKYTKKPKPVDVAFPTVEMTNQSPQAWPFPKAPNGVVHGVHGEVSNLKDMQS
jgi:hypothetical protein